MLQIFLYDFVFIFGFRCYSDNVIEKNISQKNLEKAQLKSEFDCDLNCLQRSYL